MSAGQREVSTAADLVTATADKEIGRIIVSTDLSGLKTIRLSPGQTLIGARPFLTLQFAADQHGVQLSADNSVEGLILVADVDRCALFNDTGVEHLGRLSLRGVVATGCVRLLARDRVRSGHVEAHDVDIVSADARGYDQRPKGYGVEVIAGAFMLWNQQSDPAVTITADLTGLSAGRSGAPVRGSGIFVAGGGDTGGKLIARRLETGAVYSDGGITPGTPDRISGGVFAVSGAHVDNVINRGPVTTYGPNDMVLDNWGAVDHWTAEDKITSYGPSGIGFVNFGTINALKVSAPIETFGLGARGFNVYSGTVHSADFERVVTHADGAVGIQISQPVGHIAVRRGIETYGGVGDSLVKGVVVKLPAIALSVKAGGSVRKMQVAGGVVTHGHDIDPFELNGAVDTLQVSGGFVAAGGSSVPILER